MASDRDASDAAGTDVKGRWKALDRHGVPVYDVVLMDYRAWLGLRPQDQYSGNLDDSGTVIRMDVPVGWRPPQPLLPPLGDDWYGAGVPAAPSTLFAIT